MTLRELYTAIDGDYEGVLGRMMNRESMVQKFVLKFLGDASYDTLLQSMEAGDYESAFRAAHTIKGVCANLAFNELLESSEGLTEALRDGKPAQPGEEELLARVKADYDRAYQAISAFQEGVGG